MKKRITLKDFMLAVNFEISDTFHHQWECYGPNAHSLGWERRKFNKKTRENEIVTANVVYDTDKKVVCEMEVWDENNGKVWRWINPNYLKKVKREYAQRGIGFKKMNFKIAIDDMPYEDTTPTKILNILKRMHGRRP